MFKISYHGHSVVQVRTDEHTILIDPFITGNPLCDLIADDVKCDYIILTHAHGDHLGDAIEISKRTGAEIIAMVELADYCHENGVEKVHSLNIGGCFKFPFGSVKLTIAHHSSSTPDGKYAGPPAGIIIHFDDKTIYHAGDTSLFYDMKLIGEMHKIDYAFMPAGDYFTMGPDDFVKAAEFVNADVSIPIHYNTFPPIQIDVRELKRKVEAVGKKCLVMEAGDEINL
ncbi:metal-dependent hydrolase [soil metagenome]